MTLTRKNFVEDPFQQFLSWYDLALNGNIKLPDAMTLATASREGIPSARIVLYKGLNQDGVCFFTNYESRKAQELFENPHAALVFYWPSLDRQIRIEGQIKKVSAHESDEYWNSRPRESRISAMTSQQSQVISNRDVLEKKFFELSDHYRDQDIPRPENWGGFCLIPNRFEFWINGAHRLHDRFCYVSNGKDWELLQLSP